jgi:putative Holliday junction resolvase
MQGTFYNPTVPTLAIDYGGRRIGIAVSGSDVLATPHSVIRNEGDIVEKLARVANEVGADTIVVGLARRTRTDAGERKFRALADALRQKTSKEVVLWDESFSTVEAQEQLRAAGRSARQGKDTIDMYAAAVILQSYLDRRTGRTS